MKEPNIFSRCKLDKNGCWIWQGYITPDGYGRIKFEGKNVAVHRMVMYILNKEWPTKPKQVNHRCNVRSCCNPHHLYVGTQKENIKDSFDADTFLGGEAERLERTRVFYLAKYS